MKKQIFRILMSALALVLLAVPAKAVQLTERNKQFLAAYEKVHHALASDDLDAAKAAAGEIGSERAELAKSNSLKDARGAFEKLSTKAKQIAAGQSGYYVMHCPMLKKGWVQTSEKVTNPYGGSDMVSCGELTK